MDRTMIEQVVRAVVARMEEETGKASAATVPAAAPESKPCNGCTIPVEMSARHVHLSAEDLRALFGTDTLPSLKAISQPGQYLSEYRVRLIGPKGVLDNVAVLGPVRGATQAEISATDARTLGVKAPVRLSGDLHDAAALTIQNGEQMVRRACAIIALRHVHMTPEDASAFGVQHGQQVTLAVDGERPLSLGGVVVRVSKESALALHIDTDEANASGAWGKVTCRLVPDCPPACARAEMASAPAAPQATPAPAAEATLEPKLLCERDVLTLKGKGVKTLQLKQQQIITPLALDALRALGIVLIREGNE